MFSRGTVLGEALGALELGGGLGRPECLDPGGLRSSTMPAHQRRLRPDHDEIDLVARQKRSRRHGRPHRAPRTRTLGDPGVARRAIERWVSGLAERAQASACSRPPEPMRRTFMDALPDRRQGPRPRTSTPDGMGARPRRRRLARRAQTRSPHTKGHTVNASATHPAAPVMHLAAPVFTWVDKYPGQQAAWRRDLPVRAVRLLEEPVEKRVHALRKRARVLVDHQDDLPPTVPTRDRLHLVAGELAPVAPAAARQRRGRSRARFPARRRRPCRCARRPSSSSPASVSD